MSSNASMGPTWMKNMMPPVDDRPTIPLLALVPAPATGLMALALGATVSPGNSLMKPDTVGLGTVRL